MVLVSETVLSSREKPLTTHDLLTRDNSCMADNTSSCHLISSVLYKMVTADKASLWRLMDGADSQSLSSGYRKLDHEMSLSVCLSVCPSVRLSVSPSVCLADCPRPFWPKEV